MSANRSPQWQPLPLSKNPRSAPPLLAWAFFEPDGYEIRVSDLTQVWYEKLSKSEILARAAKENTVIDPTSSSNFNILLQKLEESVTTSKSSETQSELLSVPDALVDSEGRLRLKIRHQMEAGLDELGWTFDLRHGTAVDFTNMFVLPTLSRLEQQTEQVEDLLSKLKAKDDAIDHLKDRYEDWEKLPTKRRKALTRFDKKLWEEDMADVGKKQPNEVVRQAFKKVSNVEAAEVRLFGQDADRWWQRLDDTPSITASMRSSACRSFTKEEPASNPKDKPDDDDDEFVALKTPPPPGRQSQKQLPFPYNINDLEGSETEDDEPAPALAPAPTLKKLGQIRGEKTVSPRRSPIPPPTKTESPPPPLNLGLQAIGRKTKASDAEEALISPPKTLGSHEDRKPIGRIGGGGNRVHGTSQCASSIAEPRPLLDSQLQPSLQLPRVTPSKRTASLLKETLLELEEKDADARADRKRRELEKSLEAKKKIAKKKRKF